MSNSNNEMKIGGIILCGGESTRMNYPKALLPVGNELMLQRVVRIVSGVVSPLIVIASQGQDLPDLPEGVKVIHDRESAPGPLSAIGHGLEVLKAECEAAYVSGCDTPLINVEFIEMIISRLGKNQMAMVQEGKWFHPLAAVYRTSLVQPIQQLLDSNKRRALDLAEAVQTCLIDVEDLREVDPELQGLRNINTREQYQQLLREMGLDVPNDLLFE